LHLFQRKKRELPISYSVPYKVTDASKEGLSGNLSELERLQLMMDLLYPGVKLEEGGKSNLEKKENE